MTRAQIETFIPHRDGMLLLDEASVVGDNKAEGIYHIRGDEFFLRGHFPGNPVVPGVIMCEIMAQTCAVILAEECIGKMPYFVGMKNVIFKRKVTAGETIRFVCAIYRHIGQFYFATGEGFVGDEMCVSGDFSIALVPKE